MGIILFVLVFQIYTILVLQGLKKLNSPEYEGELDHLVALSTYLSKVLRENPPKTLEGWLIILAKAPLEVKQLMTGMKEKKVDGA